MRRIKDTLRLYVMYVSVIVQGAMQYKVSFILMIIGRFIISFNGFVAISFLFSGFTQIKQYSYSDILMCFATIQMSFSIAEFFASGFKAISYTIRRGEFDRILLRPRSPILQILGTRFDLGRTGPIISSIVTLIIGIRASSIQWSIGRILTLVIMITGGMLLFSGLFMISASFCFFSIEDSGILNILTYGVRDHGKYPADVYGKRLTQFCTYIIPYALIQYYPLQYLLGKTDRWIYGLYLFGTVLFLAVCYAIWKIGVKNYKSCGS